MTAPTGNRMATTKNTTQPLPQIAIDLARAPASMQCPGCGRTISPYVFRTLPDRREAHCECRFCGAKFAYIAPGIRLMTTGDKSGA